MTGEEIKLFIEHNDDDFLKFDRVLNKLSKRPDLHAFIMLDKLFPDDDPTDIVSGAEHDEIWLGVEIDDETEYNIDAEQLLDLIRCGVRVSEYGGLCMFV